MDRKGLVIGATGLVGGLIVRELLENPAYTEVKVLTRRPLGIRHPKLTEHVISWAELGQSAHVFEGVHDLYCALGTTIKKAGSQERFRLVDLEYPLQAAKLARQAGVVQMLAVSSAGANPRSRIFYSRIKGEAEEALAEVGLPALHLFRPSLILGERSERRAGEWAAAALMKLTSPLWNGRLSAYRAIPAAVIAKAMVPIALAGARGVHVYPNEVIHALGSDPTQ